VDLRILPHACINSVGMISTSEFTPFQGFDSNFALTNTKFAYLYAQLYACQSIT